MSASRVLAVFLILFLIGAPNISAFTHEKLPVNFLAYNDETLILAKERNKPVFILISAVWCHWCHVFEKGALSDKKVYSFLNDNYINVFIDADIRRDLHFRFQATALPYIVFLNPDGSPLYKYGGTLRADDFLGLIKSLHEEVARITLDGDKKDKASFSYSPPSKLDLADIKAIKITFAEIFVGNFDSEEFGVGGGRKLLLPETFIYLAYLMDDGKNDFHAMVDGTLKKAVENIYDPIEGGFFRYAETRNWRIPHYEKMLDVNASALSLLLKANAKNPSGEFLGAAKGTAKYLSAELFDPAAGVFMSFQIADTSYYQLDARQRKKVKKPAVVKKVFVDTLSVSLIRLLEVSNNMDDRDFDKKIKQSIEFLARMVKEKKGVFHYYSMDDRKWFIPGTLADHAYLALLFTKVYKVYKNPDYLHIANKVLGYANSNFLDQEQGIYLEGSLSDIIGLEYLMGLNSVIAQAWLETAESKNKSLEIVENIIRFFSGTEGLLADRAWGARDFGFLEMYAQYLTMTNFYASRMAPTE